MSAEWQALDGRVRPGEPALRIYGASDDLVEIEGWMEEEIGCYDEPVTLRIGSVLRVTMAYDGHAGTWTAKLEQEDEGGIIPWPVTVTTVKYSICVVIGCPPGTRVEELVGGAP